MKCWDCKYLGKCKRANGKRTFCPDYKKYIQYEENSVSLSDISILCGYSPSWGARVVKSKSISVLQSRAKELGVNFTYVKNHDSKIRRNYYIFLQNTSS